MRPGAVQCGAGDQGPGANGRPRAIELDMKDILLSMPEVYLYLALVVTLLIAALWRREPLSAVGTPGRRVLRTGWDAGDDPVAAWCNLDRAPLPGFAWQPQRDRGPFPDLQATLSASYAARLEQALRSIRGGAAAGARPTGKVAG